MPSREDGPGRVTGGRARRAARSCVRVPLTTAFIGCTLVAIAPPALADPAGAAAVPPASPVLPVLLPVDTVVDKGETAELTLSVTAVEDVCVYGATADNGFTVGDRSAPGIPFTAPVDGAPEESVGVTATVSYAPAKEGVDCADVGEDERSTASSAPLQVVVNEPEPEPTDPPTETEEPTTPPPSETDEPTTPPPSETEDPTTPPPSESAEPTPTPTSGGGDGDEDAGTTSTPSEKEPAPEPGETSDPAPSADSGDGERRGDAPAGPAGGSSGGSGSDPLTPRAPADVPDLPTGDAELPSLSPNDPDDFADLPTVSPDGGEETTRNASAEEDMASAVSPAALLLVLMLLLLFAAPLAPGRRVRIGFGYRGRRRKD